MKVAPLVEKRVRDLGLPEAEKVSFWLNKHERAFCPGKLPVKKSELKNSEIPLLSNYSNNADESFWNKFPKRGLPERATTRVNIAKLEERVENVGRIRVKKASGLPSTAQIRHLL